MYLLLAVLLATAAACCCAAAALAHSFERALQGKLASVQAACAGQAGIYCSLRELMRAGELPEAVARFLLWKLGPEAERGGTFPGSACVRWRGRHRMSPDSHRWNALEGEMHVCMSGRPRFAWVGRIQLAPLVWMRGCEAYLGQGSMQWRLWGLFPLVSLEGGAMDRNGLVRYLAEAPVYPMGLVPSSFLRWEAVPGDADSARAIISDNATTASAVFTFDGQGRVVQMRSADTSRATAAGALEPCPLVARYSGHQRLYDGDHNIRVATAGELSFETPEGEFHYGTFNMVSVAYGK